MNNKILVTGGNSRFCKILKKKNKKLNLIFTTKDKLNILNINSIERWVKKIKPKWLTNSRNNRMELDGYCKKMKIAFEYQGEQHFKISRYSLGKIQLKQRILDDKQKINNLDTFPSTFKICR